MATAHQHVLVPVPVPVEPIEELENLQLPERDGIPLESDWHRAAIGLLIESVLYHFKDRTDFYAGGNMFIHFCLEQVRKHSFRGPDFFYVDGVALNPPRRYWIVWNEGGRYPDLIIELSSPSTYEEDRTTKKKIYERTFRTSEYYCYDPETEKLQGWRLGQRRRYRAIKPNERGWLWSEELKLWLGIWKGEYLRHPGTWLRFYTRQGNLVELKDETALQQLENERQRAEHERQRAEAAEAELARLKALLAQQGTLPRTRDEGTR